MAGQPDYAVAAWLSAWMGPVETLVARRGGQPCADPLLELRQLGYLPAGAEPGAWEHLDADGWFTLLRAVARRCPRLAAALAAARLTRELSCAPLAAGAIGARAAYLREHLGRAVLPVLQATAGMLVPAASAADSAGVLAPDVHDTGVRVPVATLRRVPGDLLAVASGTLWRLWDASVEHAEARPLFGRVLADFPVIRYRLLRALAAVMEAEEHARRVAAGPDDAVARTGFHATCLQVRMDTQQLCGGGGYMRASRYALTWQALEESMAILRLLPGAATGGEERARRGVQARLAALGVADARWAALFPAERRRVPLE